MDVGSSERPGIASTKQHCSGFRLRSTKTPKPSTDLHRLFTVKGVPYAHTQHSYQGDKMLCIHRILWMWDTRSEACGSQTDITTSYGLRSTPKTPKSTPDMQRCITVRVAPYAHTQHIKVPKGFVYIQYGCGIQSEARCSLNNDITTSDRLRATPQNPKAHR